ncbi:MAG: peptidoglycan editing factor PgeF [Pseudomonadota bacterium]|nr:peptidoglycan editing factor PgeF [Pseudomonadota bacterium]
MNWKKEVESRLKYPFSLDNQSGPAYLKIAAPPSITAGFTLRSGGFSHGSFASANMSFQVGDQEETVLQNRRALLYGAGAGFFSTLVTARQVHGKRCLTIVDSDPEKLEQVAQTDADALLTDQPGILLAVMTADCLPLIMIDQEQRAVAVVHVGWRGLEQSIGIEIVNEMSRRFAVDAETLQVFAGPAIGSCCFQVGIEVVDRFRRHPVLEGIDGWYQKRASGYHIDLLSIQRAQLLAAGVAEKNFHQVDICTFCHGFCFSYRRDHAITGRQLAFVGIKKNN